MAKLSYTWLVIASVGTIAGIAGTVFVIQAMEADEIGIDSIAHREPITEIELFRRNLLPGHSLSIISSFSSRTNTTGVTVANPTSHTFSDCSLIHQVLYPYYELYKRIGTDIAPLNTTIHRFDTIPPNFLEYIEAPFVPEILEENFNKNRSKFAVASMNFTEYTDKIASRSWAILECSKPRESVAFPHATIGGGYDAIEYHPGDTIRLRGIVGYSQVGIKVSEFDGKDLFVVNERLETGKGGAFDTSIMIPSDISTGYYTVWVVLPSDAMMGFGFRVI